jgi:glycosyltransferase involved in cell wall biosynthesis
MRYVFLNPFSRGTSTGAPAGIDAYVQHAARCISKEYTVVVVDSMPGMDPEAYRRFVRDEISKMDPREVVVEAPEARASSALIPADYRVHVRLHCPAALAQHHNRDVVDRAQLAREMEVVRRAQVVSAPSDVMAREVEALLPQRVAVFPHPAPPSPHAEPKDIDVLFVGRNQWLKGTDFIPPLLQRLGPGFRVVLAGTSLSMLPLGRGIHASVERFDTVLPRERDALMRRARVVVVPSRFESFSMVAAEALANHACVVGWSQTALAELAPPPLIRVVPFGDLEALVAITREAVADVRAASIDELQFVSILATWTREFASGIRWVVEKSHHRGAAAPHWASHRGAHPAAALPPTTLAQLMEEESMPPPRTQSWQRKLRKLRRDPKAFVRDSALGRVVQLPESWLERAHDQGEPRLLGTILAGPTGLEIERHEKKVSEPDLATVVFTPRSSTALRARPHLGALLADRQFVGFRDRYLFAFEYELDSPPESIRDLARLFDASPEWTKRITRQIRNVVFFDPADALPFLVRSTDHLARLIIFATDETPRPDLLERFGTQIDVLVSTPKMSTRPIAARRRISVPDASSFSAALRDLIIDHKEKEKNALIPVFGTSDYIEDIDTLMESDVDVILFLDGPVPTTGHHTFSDYLNSLAKRCKTVLLREVRFHQYRDFCESKDVRGLLHVSLEDGCRYEIRRP